MAEDRTVLMEDVRIVFRNFAGREGQYNREGDRNFSVILDPELAEKMLADGWNIKRLRSRDEDAKPGDMGDYYIQVSVSYKGRPPRIVLITSKGRNNLGENEVEVLDWVDLRVVDLIVNPYSWTVNGRSGIKAYLQSIFVTIQEDALELKYSNVEEAKALPAATSRLALEAGQDPNVFDAEVVDE